MRQTAALLAILLLNACSPQQPATPVPASDPSIPPANTANPANTAAAVPAGWKTYTDPIGFTVGYPDSLVLLPEPRPLPDRRPPLLHLVRFLDRTLAAGDTAALEPPQFSVEVYAAPPGPLRPWLEANGRIPGGAGVEKLEIPGAREAVHIRDPRMLAPNEFFWLATDRHAFLIVALGPDGDAMRKTFRLTGP